MRDAANRKGIRHAVGLQGQVSSAVNYTKDLMRKGGKAMIGARRAALHPPPIRSRASTRCG
jgi:predicted dehydrogenase